MSLRHVILGAGAAGLAALGAIRQRDSVSPVAIVWDEPDPPYARMALHRYVAGLLDGPSLFARDLGLLDRGPTFPFPGRKVSRVDTAAQSVILDDGMALPYDRLLVATGSQPSPAPIPGIELPGVLPMWTYRHAEEIVARAAGAREVVVLGAGFVGLQAVDALAAGRQVTVVEFAERVLPRMLDATSAGVVAQLLRTSGVRLLTGQTATGIALASSRPPGKLVVTLSDGTDLPADLVVVATGARPRLDFLSETPIASSYGIAVDDAMRTPLPTVYAAGDAALVSDLLTGGRAAAGIWPAAVSQGEVAGANMAGGNERYPGNLPMNIVHISGVTIASVGLPEIVDATPAQFSDGASIYRRFLWRDDRLVGCISIGAVRDLGLLREAIAEGRLLPRGKQQFAEQPWDCSAPLLAAQLLT